MRACTGITPKTWIVMILSCLLFWAGVYLCAENGIYAPTYSTKAYTFMDTLQAFLVADPTSELKRYKCDNDSYDMHDNLLASGIVDSSEVFVVSLKSRNPKQTSGHMIVAIKKGGEYIYIEPNNDSINPDYPWPRKIKRVDGYYQGRRDMAFITLIEVIK